MVQDLTPLLAVAAALAWPAAAPATPLTYRLDPAHTFATFEARHFDTSTIRGRIGPVTGDVTLDRAAGTGDVRLEIPVATVSTGSRVFDARLREPDLLSTDANPVAWFVATRFRLAAVDGAVQEVRGEFTFRGTSAPLSLTATRFACRDDARLRRQVCGGDFEASFDRSAFGATFGLPFIGNRVHLLVQVEGIAD